MNLLARILSHGFALAVVLLIGVALMYRGDLFPEWPLPEFLVIENGSDNGTDAAPPVPMDTATASAESSVTPAEAPQAEVVAQDVVAPADEAVADMDTATTESSPVTAVADTEATPEEPVVDMADSRPDAETETETGIEETSAGVPDEAAVAVPLDNEIPDQTETTPVVAPPAIDMTSDAVTEQVEAAPVAPPAIDTTSDAVTEEAEAAPAAPPASDTTSETATEPTEVAPAVPPASDTTRGDLTEPAEVAPATAPASDMTSEAVAEQVESPAQELETSTPAAGQAAAAEPEPEPAVAQLPVAPAGDSDGKKAYELLAAAREAYWLHDFEMAETNYQQLIQMEPDNPDGYGELGNMYFAQGQWEQAAAAYYEAGVRLLETGMVEEARQMVDVIRGLNGAQADDLEERINAAS